MDLATVVWILGGWFVFAAGAGLLIGRLLSINRPGDLPGAFHIRVAEERPSAPQAGPSKAA